MCLKIYTLSGLKNSDGANDSNEWHFRVKNFLNLWEIDLNSQHFERSDQNSKVHPCYLQIFLCILDSCLGKTETSSMISPSKPVFSCIKLPRSGMGPAKWAQASCSEGRSHDVDVSLWVLEVFENGRPKLWNIFSSIFFWTENLSDILLQHFWLEVGLIVDRHKICSSWYRKYPLTHCVFASPTDSPCWMCKQNILCSHLDSSKDLLIVLLSLPTLTLCNWVVGSSQKTPQDLRFSPSFGSQISSSRQAETIGKIGTKRTDFRETLRWKRYEKMAAAAALEWGRRRRKRRRRW